jgi:hypothetical protein
MLFEVFDAAGNTILSTLALVNDAKMLREPKA